MKQHWYIEKLPSGKWALKSLAYLDDGTCSGWQTLSTYKTRKAAITVGMILRERGEPISWQGGPIRMGIALVESCKMVEA